jgi:hypothetical protein
MTIGQELDAIVARIAAIEAKLTYDPQVQWKAGMETGNLSEWDDQTNSGSALSIALLAANVGIAARTGSWVMAQAVTGASGGTRMARFPEIAALTKAGTPWWLTWWDYYPAQIKFGLSDMWAFGQLGGYDLSAVPQPIWGLFVSGTTFVPSFGWGPSGGAPAEGPHAGETTQRQPYVSLAGTPLPVGRWFKNELYVKPAADFTGAIKFWADGVLHLDQSSVKTRFPGTGDTPTTGLQYYTHLAYGSNLTPTPAVHYVDDVTISLQRMP